MRAVLRGGLAACVLALADPGWAGPFTIDAEQEATLALEKARAALQQQQAALADQWLERVLMYHPDHAEAQLMLAQSMALRGAYGPAIAMVQNLLDDPSTPEPFRPGLAQVLQHYRKALAAATPTDDAARATYAPGLQLSLQAGWARNPASRTDDANLPLTTLQGVIDLPLSQRPEPGLTDNLMLGWTTRDGHRLWGQSQGAAAGGVDRVYQAGADYRLGGRWTASGELKRQGGQTGRWALTVSHAQPGWSALAGWFDEAERQRRGWLLGAQTLWLQTPTTLAQTALTLELNTQAQGVGGHQIAWQYRHQQLLAAGLTGQLSVRLQSDSKGYSPLLENGAPRRLATLRAGLAWQPWQAHAGALEVYHEQRFSNIGLFAYRDWGLLWRQQWVWRP